MEEHGSAELGMAAEDEGGRGRGLGILLVAFGLLAAYPLSVGPVAKLGVIPNSVVGAVYSPLGILYRQWAPAKRFFDWYLGDVWHVK